nr:MAG: hypothetical protein EDM05_35705 [Leptolyngbya sp. IPPAS B-1204]RNJ64596.1 MAG: hypothetical protein EDM05_35670 [Leptolyngbya sp. IPPAS B-1204]
MGELKGLVEAVTGKDLITGEDLAAWERMIGIIPYVSDVGKLIHKAGDLARAVEAGSDAAKAAAASGDAKKALEAAEAANTAEKILEDAGVSLPEGTKQAVDEAQELARQAGYQEVLTNVPGTTEEQLRNLSRQSNDLIDLIEQEIRGGHSIARHGSHLTPDDLQQRVLGTHPTLPQARSALRFANDQVHYDSVNQAFRYHEADIRTHFASGGGPNSWSFDYGQPTGEGFYNNPNLGGTRKNPVLEPIPLGATTRIRIAFVPDATAPDGFRLVSAFPEYP